MRFFVVFLAYVLSGYILPYFSVTGEYFIYFLKIGYLLITPQNKLYTFTMNAKISTVFSICLSVCLELLIFVYTHIYKHTY